MVFAYSATIESGNNADPYDDSNEKLWIVTRSLKSNDKKVDYKLQRQDVIKLGRVKFKVMDFRVETSATPSDRVIPLIRNLTLANKAHRKLKFSLLMFLQKKIAAEYASRMRAAWKILFFQFVSAREV
jgi:hypothetical protein